MSTNTTKVTLKKVPAPDEVIAFELNLQLTMTEARDLLAMTDYIGGEPEGTRGVFDHIRAVLFNAGVKRTPYGSTFEEEDRGAFGLHFKSRSKRTSQ
jgi:hypothetical protein